MENYIFNICQKYDWFCQKWFDTVKEIIKIDGIND